MFSKLLKSDRADTYDSTILWIPDLLVAVCGGVVYRNVHRMLAEMNTNGEKRWLVGKCKED
jgi:hypothetical protein